MKPAIELEVHDYWVQNGAYDLTEASLKPGSGFANRDIGCRGHTQ